MSTRRGFSLVEMMVIITILGIVMYSVSDSLSGIFRSTKLIDQKQQVQAFENLINLNMGNSVACRAALGIARDASGILINADAANPDQAYRVIAKNLLPSATVSALPEISVPRLTMSGSVYTFDGTQGDQDMVYKSMAIKFKGKPNDGAPDIYPAALLFQIEKKNPANSAGPAIFTRSVEMNLQLVDHPSGTNGSMKQIADCFTVLGGTSKGDQMCTELGGRWLQGNPPSSYMPKNRCTMSGELQLAVNEAPEGIPLAGGSNADGERIEECFYTNSAGTVAVYACPGGSGNRRGYRCSFSMANKAWQQRFYPGGGPNPNNTIYKTCDKGVKVSLRSPTVQTISMRQELQEGFQTTFTDAHLDEQDRLSAVTGCQTSYDLEYFSPCINVTNADGARSGIVGSCIYARGIKLSGTTQAQMNAYLLSEGLTAGSVDVNNYTGWIQVSIARSPYNPTVSGNVKPMLREARGKACFNVTLNTSVEAANLTVDTTSTAETTELHEQPTAIKQCLYTAPATETSGSGAAPAYGYGPVANAPAMRSTIFTCNNTPMGGSGGSNHEIPWAWTGQVLGTPNLVAGTCWYFKDVKVATYHVGAPANAMPTSFNTLQYPVTMTPSSSWVVKSYWTGWVYLTAALADAKFRPQDGNYVASATPPTSGSLYTIIDVAMNPLAGGAASYPKTAITGYPCNMGIRTQ